MILLQQSLSLTRRAPRPTAAHTLHTFSHNKYCYSEFVTQYYSNLSFVVVSNLVKCTKHLPIPALQKILKCTCSLSSILHPHFLAIKIKIFLLHRKHGALLEVTNSLKCLRCKNYGW
jgi:hypothetical protein